MSIELPEASILAEQMRTELIEKQVATLELKDYKKMQRIGFINRDITEFNQLIKGKIKTITSRGNLIILKFDNALNLLLGPEYGGKIRYFPKEETVLTKFHLSVHFSDKSALTITLTGIGMVQALKDEDLQANYLYRRDFSQVPSPLDRDKFTIKSFSKNLSSRNVNIKSALVGKDAVLVGLSNSAFQDIIYRAKIHPKRKASSLNVSETNALYNAVRLLITERIKLGGKEQFTDLSGRQGRYVPAMGPNMKGQACPTCGTKIEQLSLGGGIVFFCPKCQV